MSTFQDIKNGRFYLGDCLEVMKEIPDGVVDMILCDLPYGTTGCSWDSIIPVAPLWEQYHRVIKDNGVIVLTASQPFTTILIASNIERFRYNWVWVKPQGIDPFVSKVRPLNNIEDVLVFFLDKAEVTGRSKKFKDIRDWFYNERQKLEMSTTDLNRLLGNVMTSRYFTKGVQFTLPTEENFKKLQQTGGFRDRKYEDLKKQFDEIAETCRFTYNPQMTEGAPYSITRDKKSRIKETNAAVMKETTTVNKGDRLPTRTLYIKQQKGLHPTQKPVELFEYLIRTYTNEGELVLDNCAGSGTTAIAAENSGRKWVCIEQLEEYANKAVERILNHKAEVKADSTIQIEDDVPMPEEGAENDGN